MTPQERLAYAERLLEALPKIGDFAGGLSEAQMVTEVLRWNAVAMMATAHVALATAHLASPPWRVVQNTEPWSTGEIRPCPGTMEHVAHRHYDDGTGEWWCPGLERLGPTEPCTFYQNQPHGVHRYFADGRRHWCPGIPVTPQSCGEHNNWPHKPHLYGDNLEKYCSGRPA